MSTSSQDKPTFSVGVFAAILNEKNELLCVRARNGHGKEKKIRWTLPGGEHKFNKTLQEQLKDEIREETALEAEIGELIAVYEAVDEDKGTIMFLFAVNSVEGELSNKNAPKEVSEIAYFSQANLPTPRRDKSKDEHNTFRSWQYQMALDIFERKGQLRRLR
jgi:ADP-ribose pyrophosphatase YjhB (NUDIX family)